MSHPPRPAAAYSISAAAFLTLGCGGSAFARRGIDEERGPMGRGPLGALMKDLAKLRDRPDDRIANSFFTRSFALLGEFKTREAMQRSGRSEDLLMVLYLMDTNCGTDALIKASRSRHPLVRGIATGVLARTTDLGALPRLRDLFENPTAGLDKELLKAFHSRAPGEDARRAEEHCIWQTREALVTKLGRREADVFVRWLGERLPTASHKLKVRIIRSLGKTKADSAVPLIRPFLRDPKLKTWAVSTLRRIGTPAAERALLEARRDDDVRTMAEYALAGIGTEVSLPLLVKLLEKTKRGNLPVFIIRRLREIGDKAATDVLLQHLDTGRHRCEVILALGCTGDERAVKPICDVLAKLAQVPDRRRRVREEDRDLAACARALGELGSREAVGELIRLLPSGSPPVRLEALGALLKLGQRERAAAVAAYLDPLKGIPKHINTIRGHPRDHWIKKHGKDLRARAAELLMAMGETHNTRIVFDLLARHWDDRESYKLTKKFRALAPKIVPTILEFLDWRDAAEGDPMTWFLIDLLASAKDKRSTAVLKRAYKLFGVARERMHHRRDAGGIQKRLALALKELTGKDYKYLRMIPFE